MTANKSITREVEHLVSMANDIAVNLSFHEDADDRICDHIVRFWAPRMRTLLLEHADNGGEGLSKHLLPALIKLRG